MVLTQHYNSILSAPAIATRRVFFNSRNRYYQFEASGSTEIPADIPHNAFNVYIKYNRIPKIKANTFSQLRQCTTVEMLYNWVSEVEPGAFNGLTAVEKFQFCFNSLKRLFTNIFSDLVSVTDLELQYNGISEIQSRSFNRLRHLKNLKLFSNRLTTIRAGIFNGLSKLETLDLQYNQLTALRADTFQGLVNVTTIDLNSNSISSIQYNAFTNLKKLTTIKLERNALETLSAGTFSSLEFLRSLDLRGNRLTRLTADVFNRQFFSTNRRLTLALGEPSYDQPVDIPLKCDAELCWLKKEEEKRTITWLSAARYAIYKPRCADGIDWTDWDCSEIGNVSHIISFILLVYQYREIHLVLTNYRLGTVNSKSFVSKVLLRIKWNFELTVHFKHEMLEKYFMVTSN